MSLHRKNYIAKDGERFGLLVDHNNIPDFWTTLYLTTNLRYEKHSTQKACLNHLVHFYLWEMIQGERIFERIINFSFDSNISNNDQFYTDLEIQKLADHCRLKTVSARRKILERDSKKREDNTLKILFPVYKMPDPKVGKELFSNRLTTFADYFDFIAKNILRERAAYSTYLDIIDNTRQAILRQKKRGGHAKNKTNDPNRKSPPPEVFKYLMEIVEPSNDYNPYTISVRQRNYLLFKILYDTGLRAGEILQLKVSDINFAQCEIMVRARHDDPEDIFRKDEPNAKTLERDIPISESLRDQIREYVLNERRFIPNIQKHSFLFVSYKGLTKGQPLSSIQFSRIVEKIAINKELAQFIKTNGILVDKRVTRHGFRHNLNNKLSKAIDQNNKDAINEGRIHDFISEKKEIEQRMYINGHKSEKSAEVYNLRHTKEQAEKLLKVELEIIDQGIKEGRNQ
ncbi:MULTISPECIES: site-specific integrase [unclassified Acinetobacter]|uniref:tyrosine-type recombinase/integrase n=1 Tax=unclassified Acinetobacter TaxID=196816 RepID=UPI002575E2AC|nr:MULTISPECIES: site-specific integrase [unclassified Acinetobacter]MDM1764232.1 site-specific integrase [Acinetobacter sp. 226-1]MDM1767871.1 site-specific integrase [Acinetobacter sp. 226-4]